MLEWSCFKYFLNLYQWRDKSWKFASWLYKRKGLELNFFNLLKLLFKPNIKEDNLCHGSTRFQCVTWNSDLSDWFPNGCAHEMHEKYLHKCVCDHTGDIAVMALANEVILKLNVSNFKDNLFQIMSSFKDLSRSYNSIKPSLITKILLLLQGQCREIIRCLKEIRRVKFKKILKEYLSRYL